MPVNPTQRQYSLHNARKRFQMSFPSTVLPTHQQQPVRPLRHQAVRKMKRMCFFQRFTIYPELKPRNDSDVVSLWGKGLVMLLCCGASWFCHRDQPNLS